MDNTGSKDFNILCYEILRQHSNADHKLSQRKIATLIRDVYGMSCDRKSISRNNQRPY